MDTENKFSLLKMISIVSFFIMRNFCKLLHIYKSFTVKFQGHKLSNMEGQGLPMVMGPGTGTVWTGTAIAGWLGWGQFIVPVQLSGVNVDFNPVRLSKFCLIASCG